MFLLQTTIGFTQSFRVEGEISVVKNENKTFEIIVANDTFSNVFVYDTIILKNLNNYNRKQSVTMYLKTQKSKLVLVSCVSEEKRALLYAVIGGLLLIFMVMVVTGQPRFS